jgi:hypothetical protein
MRKGSVFLLLTFVGLMAVFYFLFFHYEKPKEGLPSLPHSADAPRGDITGDCGRDSECFVAAIEDDCRIVTFLLPNPLNSTVFFNGRVIGPILSKCEVYIEDITTNQSMRCHIDESAFENIKSPEGLRAVCSGDLLDRILLG